MTLNDIELYSLRSIAVLGSNVHYQITVGNVTLPKAVLSTVKIFAAYIFTSFRPQTAESILGKNSLSFLYVIRGGSSKLSLVTYT